MTVIRTQKDKNNPYVMLNKGFLEDPSISLRLKGFIAYCMSKPNDWKFHVRQLASVLKESKDALYAIINEGIDHGYIERSAQQKSGKFTGVDYVIHEVRIKEKSTVSDFPDPEVPDTEKPTLLSNDPEQVMKEQKKEGGKPPASPPPVFIDFGRYVKLTRNDLIDLNKRFGEKAVNEVIEDINDYISGKGLKPYKDYAAVIRQWMKKKNGSVSSSNQNTALRDPGEIQAENLSWIRTLYSSHKDAFQRTGIRATNTDYVEFPKVNSPSVKVYYNDPKFQDVVSNELRKLDIL